MRLVERRAAGTYSAPLPPSHTAALHLLRVSASAPCRFVLLSLGLPAPGWLSGCTHPWWQLFYHAHPECKRGAVAWLKQSIRWSRREHAGGQVFHIHSLHRPNLRLIRMRKRVVIRPRASSRARATYRKIGQVDWKIGDVPQITPTPPAAGVSWWILTVALFAESHPPSSL